MSKRVGKLKKKKKKSNFVNDLSMEMHAIYQWKCMHGTWPKMVKKVSTFNLIDLKQLHVLFGCV